MMATITIMPAMICFCMEMAITATAKAVSPIMTQSIIIRRANLLGSLIIICLFCNKVLKKTFWDQNLCFDSDASYFPLGKKMVYGTPPYMKNLCRLHRGQYIGNSTVQKLDVHVSAS